MEDLSQLENLKNEEFSKRIPRLRKHSLNSITNTLKGKQF